MQSHDLVGRVAADRLSRMLDPRPPGRLLYGILGLHPEVACAIAREVASLPIVEGRVDACIHPDLACADIGLARVSDETATHHRNHADADVVLTLFSVPAKDVKSVEQSLSHVDRIDDEWLLEDIGPWVAQAMPGADEDTQRHLEAIIQGLIKSRVGFDARRVAAFVSQMVEYNQSISGTKLANAARRALPSLHLPSDCGDPRAELRDVAEAEQFFRRTQEEFKPFLHLQGKDGETLARSTLLARLKSLKAKLEISDQAETVLTALLNDPLVGDGGWTDSQKAAAELPWEITERLFSDDQRKVDLTFGEETRKFFAEKYPKTLTKQETKLLADLKSESARTKDAFDAFFQQHLERLKTNPKLYRRWEKLVFKKSIETSDLAEGLLRLAKRARPDPEEGSDSVLCIVLDGGDTLDFWTEDKNTKLCRLLRDRWRGLDALFDPDVILDFGRCWSEPWEQMIPDGTGEVTSTSKDAVTFSFKAFGIPRSALRDNRPIHGATRSAARAQLLWTPKADTMATAFPLDLVILKEDAECTPLLTATVSANRSNRHGADQSVNLGSAATITDVLGDSNGILANPLDPENRVDERWRKALSRTEADGILTSQQAALLSEAFGSFQALYTLAIQAMGSGIGLADPALLAQAEQYGALLHAVAQHARAEVCVRELWAPLLRIGTAYVDGPRPAVIVTPWNPLRLAEIGAKARQLAEGMRRIVHSPTRLAGEMDEYVKNLARVLSRSYYVDVGATPTVPSIFLSETRHLADVSLLEPPTTAGNEDVLADEPAEEAVKKFDEVAATYLKLRPHEKASFSAVLLNAESEDLPVMLAESMARRIESEPGLRCDLVLTHENIGSLRRIYERQNRRIGHEVDASLTSEAARNFLSRLRVAIVDPQLLDIGEAKVHDIVVLQDLIARRAQVKWMRAKSVGLSELSTCQPTVRSKRKPFRKGDTTTGTYLTAPGHPSAMQAYVDALHDVIFGRASEDGDPWLPMQEVEFQSGPVKEVLAKAHRLGSWVMTFDRLADRRLISSTERRIICDFTEVGSDHNVIVSTEISEEALGERLIDDLTAVLPSEDPASLKAILRVIHRRSASLSGAIVMRAAQRLNYAQELLGLVLSLREMELLLAAEPGEQRTAWFFLDDFVPRLSLDGTRADLLGVNFTVTSAGPRIRVVVGEAKYVGQAGLTEQRNRSLEQLSATYRTLHERLVVQGGTVDPETWRNRLADLVLEHIEPFDQLAGRSFAQLLEDLRSLTTPIEMSGHSLVFVHDTTIGGGDGLFVPDADEPRANRRPIAQWVLGRDGIGKSLRSLVRTDAQTQLWIPADWPMPGSVAEVGISEPEEIKQVPIIGQGADYFEERDETINVPLADGETADEGESDLQVSCLTETPMLQPGWLPEVHAVALLMSHQNTVDEGAAWLEDQVRRLQLAIQKEGMDAPVVASRLTPNSGLVELDGKAVTVSWLEKKQVELLTKYSMDIIRISPKPGRIAVGLRRPKRVTLHLADAWLRRTLEATAPSANMALLIGEKEDDGDLFYLPLGGQFRDQERAAPHSLVSGTTGSGKGILATSLILDACAFNDPEILNLRLIDPKKGVDYAWVKHLPHLLGEIVDTKEDAIQLFRNLVQEMEDRYETIKLAGVANIDQYNRKLGSKAARMPRVLVFFDEVANWMQDDDFKDEVEPLINEIATKSRAAGINMFMIYQRADNQVMTMQLRANLGNKLILRLSDEGSSKVAMSEKGAERLLGKGHLIAKLDSDEKVYAQVPYLGEDDVLRLAEAIGAGWAKVSAFKLAALKAA
jgi:S-DNA-T family DNA segregation ATPase FtsK/SpoIIIE